MEEPQPHHATVPPQAPLTTRIAAWTLAALFVVLPITFSPIPFAPITALLQHAIALLLLGVASVALGIGAMRSRTLVLPRFGLPTTTALAVLAVGLGASLLHAPARHAAFWGTDRAYPDAILPILIGIVALVLIPAVCSTTHTLKRIARAMEIGTFLALADFAVQVAIANGNDGSWLGFLTGHTPSGTPTMLAALFAIGLLLSLGALTARDGAKRTRVRIAHSLVAVLIASALFALGNRSAFLALGIGAIVLLALWFRSVRDDAPRHPVALNALVATILLALAFARFGPGALASLRLPIEVMVSERASWTIAGAALRADTATFLIGNGPGTYAQTYDLHRPDGVNATPLWNATFTQGASWWTTILPSLGILPTLALFALFMSILVHAIRTIARTRTAQPEHDVTIASAAAASTALATSFLIPTNTILTVFLFALFGLLAASTTTRTVAVRVETPLRSLGTSLALCALILLVGAAMWFSGQRVVAASTAWRIRSALGSDATIAERTTARAVLTRAFERFPDAARAQAIATLATAALRDAVAATTDANVATQRPIAQAAIADAVRYAALAVALEPTATRWAFLGSIARTMMGIADDAAPRAIAAYERAIALAPHTPEHYIALAYTYHILAEIHPEQETPAHATARTLITQALERKPDYAPARELSALLQPSVQ